MIALVPIITLSIFGIIAKTAESGITVVFIPLSDKFFDWMTPLDYFTLLFAYFKVGADSAIIT